MVRHGPRRFKQYPGLSGAATGVSPEPTTAINYAMIRPMTEDHDSRSDEVAVSLPGGARDAGGNGGDDGSDGTQPLRVGVLALQGAFREHRLALQRLGASVREVRLPEHLHGLHGVIIPGGESTTMVKLMTAFDLDRALADFFRRGGALWGTCAGAIVLANEIVGHSGQHRLGFIDMAVARNDYGRQVASFETDLDVAGLEQPFHAVFIRAPRIVRVGAEVEVLSRYRDDPVLVRQGELLASVFHPELTDDDRIHQLFLNLLRASQPAPCSGPTAARPRLEPSR